MPLASAFRIRREIASNFESVKFWGRNARVLVATEALFAVFMSWVFFYQAIFMRTLGLDEITIGLVVTVPSLIQIFLPMLGGYLADRFGRKRTLLLFDSVGWIGAMFLWFVAKNLLQVVLAVLLQGLTTTIYGVWETLLVEDTEPQYRVSIYSLIHLLYVIAGILTPVAGALVTAYGIEQGCRYMFLLALLALAALMAIRTTFLVESKTGQILSTRNADADKVYGSNYMEVFRLILTNRKLLAVFFLISLGNVQYQLVNTYRPLYLSDPRGLGLDEGSISVIPMASSVPSLIALLFLVPRIRQTHVRKAVIYSYALGILGFLTLVLAPKGSLAFATLSAVLDSARYIATFALLRTLLVNAIDEIKPLARAKIMSVSISLPALISWFSPTAGGFLYSIGPSMPFIASTLLLILSMGFANYV